MKKRFIKIIIVLSVVMFVITLIKIAFGWMAIVYGFMLPIFISGAVFVGLMTISILRYIFKGEF
jgi:pilus assembly protein TadC